MVYVDERAGSSDLVPLLRGKGLPVTKTRLDFGDIYFVGSGPDDRPVPIGIEVKSIRDVLCCITDGRFAGHQLPGLLESYEVAWLLVEGGWRYSLNPKTAGMLEIRRNNGQWSLATVGTRTFMYRDLLTWFLTVQHKAGLRVVSCTNWVEATVWISTNYHWWTEKKYEQHRSHLALHNDRNSELFDRAILVRPSLCRLLAKELPGVGVGKSAAVAAHFVTSEAMLGADVTDWEQVPGIGRTMAERIYRAIRDPR